MINCVIKDRMSIVTIDPSESHVIISISDWEGRRPAVPFKSTCQGVLKLNFHDVEHQNYSLPVTTFTDAISNEILDFYELHKDNVETFFIHCDAGKCRSPAVGAALTVLSGGSNLYFYQNYSPNKLVYRLLIKAGLTRYRSKLDK